MKNRRLLGHRNLSVILSLTITLFPLPTFASDPTPPEFKSRTEGSNATLSGNYGEGESDPGTDQGTYQSPSGGGDPLPEGTPEPPSAINDFAFGYHCEHPVSYESGHLMFPTYVRCDDPPSSDTTPSTPPSTRTILRRAAATVHADGAGINKQPPGVSYTNRFVPTIVSVTNPTQTHTVTLFGREVTVTFTAMSYEWN